MFSVISQIQRQDYILYDSIYIKHKKKENYSHRKQISGFLKLEVEQGGQWELTDNRYKRTFRSDGSVLKGDCGDSHQCVQIY